jgi:hypothetical protein
MSDDDGPETLALGCLQTCGGQPPLLVDLL